MVVGLVVAVMVARMAFRAHLRRSFREIMLAGSPSFQVTVLGSREGRTRARLELHGTTEPLEVTSISAPRGKARTLGLELVGAFQRYDEPSDTGGETVSWRPVGGLVAHPDQPLEVEFSWDPDAHETAAVFGQAEGRLEEGGVGTGFTVLVGPRSPLEVEATNLRSALYARARREGVVPRDLPEWSELESLEARLADEGRGGDGPGERSESPT